MSTDADLLATAIPLFQQIIFRDVKQFDDLLLGYPLLQLMSRDPKTLSHLVQKSVIPKTVDKVFAFAINRSYELVEADWLVFIYLNDVAHFYPDYTTKILQDPNYIRLLNFRRIVNGEEPLPLPTGPGLRPLPAALRTRSLLRLTASRTRFFSFAVDRITVETWWTNTIFTPGIQTALLAFFDQLIGDRKDRQAALAAFTRLFAGRDLLAVLRDFRIQYAPEEKFVAASEGRSENRLRNIEQFIRLSSGSQYLDVGGGDGSISSLIAQKLNTVGYVYDVKLPEKRFDRIKYLVNRGTNVIAQWHKGIKGWHFETFDNQFNLVTMLMAMHHFDNLDQMLSEVVRVMKNEGILIIREHDLAMNIKDKFKIDLTTEEKRSYLDWIHLIYETIEWLSPAENDRAHYKTRADWTAILARYGFRSLGFVHYPNIQYSYFEAFKLYKIGAK